MRRETLDAFVVRYNHEERTYSAFCSQNNPEITISQQFVPPNTDLRGRWIQAEVFKNVVTGNIFIISDVFETRFVCGEPEIRVEAVHNGLLQNGIATFYHQTIGFICDSDYVINNPQSSMIYTLWIRPHKEENVMSYWKLSIEQRTIFPNRPEVKADEKLRTISGIIHSRTDQGVYIAWSKDEPTRRFYIWDSNCPRSGNMIGFWVEMNVDNYFEVQGSVVRIEDPYKTRIIDNVLEINIDFESILSGGAEVFYHPYFQYICDPRNVFQGRPRSGVRYNGWIAYDGIEGTNAYWRLVNDSYDKSLQNDRKSQNEYYSQERIRSPPHIPNQYEDQYTGHSQKTPGNFPSQWNREHERGQQYERVPSSSSSFVQPIVYSGEQKMNRKESRKKVSAPPRSDSSDSDSDDFEGACCFYETPNQSINGNSQAVHHADEVPENQETSGQQKKNARRIQTKETKTAKELERFKLKSELILMQNALTLLMKDEKCLAVCKRAELEDHEDLMALIHMRMNKDKIIDIA
ncbi:hypothetical protein L5515_011523 [Caenorhabditis briggsae]|uniref:Uncharacterized protein n=1 Tax=Caenorhabditis briggsae TaxID=6238 RepID=A0AAE9EV96_CAEBR|nr:hypothetical protein L5515_011523 [Caenorhabditis briggsae]